MCRHSDFFRESAAYNYTFWEEREREGDYEKMFGKGNRLLKKEQSHIAQLTHSASIVVPEMIILKQETFLL